MRFLRQLALFYVHCLTRRVATGQFITRGPVYVQFLTAGLFYAHCLTRRVTSGQFITRAPVYVWFLTRGMISGEKHS